MRPNKVDAWQDYRRRRSQFWFFVVFGLVCIVALPQIALVRLNMDRIRVDKNAVFFVSISIFFPILLFLSIRLANCKCPNCGKPFHSNPLYLYGNLLSSACVNCHTPVGGPAVEADKQSG